MKPGAEIIKHSWVPGFLINCCAAPWQPNGYARFQAPEKTPSPKLQMPSDVGETVILPALLPGSGLELGACDLELGSAFVCRISLALVP